MDRHTGIIRAQDIVSDVKTLDLQRVSANRRARKAWDSLPCAAGAGEGWGGGTQSAVMQDLPPSQPSPACEGRSRKLG